MGIEPATARSQTDHSTEAFGEIGFAPAGPEPKLETDARHGKSWGEPSGDRTGDRWEWSPRPLGCEVVGHWACAGDCLQRALRHHGQAETHDLLPAPRLPGPEVDGGPEDPLKTFIFSISGGSSAGAWWWEHVTDVYQSSIPGGSLCGRVALNIRLPVVVTALPTLSLETAWASDVKLTTSSPGGMA